MWETKKNAVEEPEMENRHGRERVEADIGAAGMEGVTDKRLPLVTEEGEAGE